MTEEKTLEEKIRDAEEVPEAQVEIEKGEVQQAGEIGAEYMTAPKVLSAGEVYIYDTRTHERSLCRRNNLPHKLRLKRPDGSLVFTTVKPKALPKRGVLKCLLHPDERKPLYDDWGFPTCRKSNLTSPFQVRRHMQKRHRQEWEAIEEERKRVERLQDRQLQETLISNVKPKEAPLYVSDKKKK